MNYARFNIGIWLVTSALGLASGAASGLLPIVQFLMFIISWFVLIIDLSRFNFPGFAGLVDAAKDEFKNKELQEFLNGVNKEKK